MTDQISPDAPELRLLAQFCGLAPAKLAAALNEPERFPVHLTLDEFTRFGEGIAKLNPILQRMNVAALMVNAYIEGMKDGDS